MTNRERQEIETILLNFDSGDIIEIATELAQRFGKRALDILIDFEKGKIVSSASGEDVSMKATEIIRHFPNI